MCLKDMVIYLVQREYYDNADCRHRMHSLLYHLISFLPPAMDSYTRPELFNFHGVWMTHYFTDSWEDVQNFEARSDDILVATYPKAGQRTKRVHDFYLSSVDQRKRFVVMWFITLFSSFSFALSFRNNVGVPHSRFAVFWSDAPGASNLRVHLSTGSIFGNQYSVRDPRFDPHTYITAIL